MFKKIKPLKFFIFSSIAIIFLLVITICVGYFSSAFIFAHRISKTTQTPVTINAVKFHQQAFTIQNLVIGNPKEAYIPTAFRAESVEVDVPYKEFFKSQVTIDEIKMDNVFIDIEFYTEDKMEGNWQALIENMAAPQKSSKEKQLTQVKKLVLTNIHVTLILSDGRIHRLSPIPELVFNDITTKEGIPLEGVSEIIARKMVYSILKEDGLNLIIKVPLKVIKKIIPFL